MRVHFKNIPNKYQQGVTVTENIEYITTVSQFHQQISEGKLLTVLCF